MRIVPDKVKRVLFRRGFWTMRRPGGIVRGVIFRPAKARGEELIPPPGSKYGAYYEDMFGRICYMSFAGFDEDMAVHHAINWPEDIVVMKENRK